MDIAGVHVEVTGDGPRTVVLLHGFSDNANTWRRVVPALATRFRVVALDLPGHGRSTRAWPKPLVAGYAELVAEIMTELDVATAALIGNSMGACVAAVFASLHPRRTERIVLVGMPGIGRIPTAWRIAATRPAVCAMRLALSPVPVRTLQHGFGWIYARAATPRPGALDPNVLHDYFDTYADREKLFGLGAIARELLAELRTLHLDRTIAALDVPVLRIWGRHDRLVPSRRARSQAGAVVMGDCGHCPQLDAPDRLLEVVLPFLTGAPPPPTHGSARDGSRTRAPRS